MSDDPDIAQFFADVRAAATKSERHAIGVILRHFNARMLAGDFKHCDEILRRAAVPERFGEVGATLAVSMLVVTFAAKPRLRNRDAMYATTRAGLLRIHDAARVKKILVGLE